MDNKHLDLSHEFPEFKDAIHELKINDAHFSRLYEKYTELSQKIHKSEQRLELMSEHDEEVLRKERVKIKDELYSMLKNYN